MKKTHNLNFTLFLISTIITMCGIFTCFVGISYFFHSAEEWVEMLKDIRPEHYVIFAFFAFITGLFTTIIPFTLLLGKLVKEHEKQRAEELHEQINIAEHTHTYGK